MKPAHICTLGQSRWALKMNTIARLLQFLCPQVIQRTKDQSQLRYSIGTEEVVKETILNVDETPPVILYLLDIGICLAEALLTSHLEVLCDPGEGLFGGIL